MNGGLAGMDLPWCGALQSDQVTEAGPTGVLPVAECSTSAGLAAKSVQISNVGLVQGGRSIAGCSSSAGLAGNSDFEVGDSSLKGAALELVEKPPVDSFEGLLEKLSSCADLAEFGVWLAWGLKLKLFSPMGSFAGPPQTAGRPVRSGGLFPLPVIFPEFEGSCEPGLAAMKSREVAIGCWQALGAAAANKLYGCSLDGTLRKPGKVHRAAFKVLSDRIGRFLDGSSQFDLDFSKICSELKERKISYTGEEIAQPVALSVEQIETGLPPIGHGGSVELVKFLKGRTRYLMENPLECVLPEKEWGSSPLQARVHIRRGEELKLFGLLESRGVIKWVPADTAFATSRGPILNGLFGVVKQGRFTSTQLPVLRVIMNLIPANSILSIIHGDINCLPSASSWIPLVISEQGELCMSQGDMSCAFYLFSVPSQWQTFMCFNFTTDGSSIGLQKGTLYRPACLVLPMGWSSSVGVMQQASREILLSFGFPPHLELKKGSPLPSWFTQVLEATTPDRAWWQVYLDNFMAADAEGQGCQSVNGHLQSLAMRAWESAGILSAEDKQVLSSTEVVELGVRLDGSRGLLGVSPERLLKTLLASVYFLQKPRWDKKLAQIILGRWVFVLQFRRAGMGCLSRSRETVESPWPNPQQVLRLHREVLALMCLAPLLQTDLKAEYDHVVSCSDASEVGGASACSTGLTWSGKSLVSFSSDQRLQPIARPILLISVFNGMGGMFRIYDVLGIKVDGRISVDISRTANRVTRSTWPNVMELHDITELKKDDVWSWANAHPRIEEVHVMAGFPCVHLSSVRSGRQNLSGDGSKLFWNLLTILSWIQEIFGSYCRVKFCVENVASMDEDARREISACLGIVPIKLDPADVLPTSRPRLAWCSEELYQMEGLQLWSERDYFRAVVDCPGVPVASWIRPGWKWEGEEQGIKFPTFMKAIRRERPPPSPAGFHRAAPETLQRWREDEFRFPPYQYAAKFLVSHTVEPSRTLDSSEREILLGFGPGHTRTCMSASEAKRSSVAYEDARKSLCGDSYAILSFAIMASQMCAHLVPRMKPSQIVQRLGLAPGASCHPDVVVPMSRWLSYGGDPDQAPGDVHELVKCLGLTVNHTGCDVRVSTGQLLGRKSPAHGSVRSWWWQWKHLFKVRWVRGSHINFFGNANDS